MYISRLTRSFWCSDGWEMSSTTTTHSRPTCTLKDWRQFLFVANFVTSESSCVPLLSYCITHNSTSGYANPNVTRSIFLATKLTTNNWAKKWTILKLRRKKCGWCSFPKAEKVLQGATPNVDTKCASTFYNSLWIHHYILRMCCITTIIIIICRQCV